MKRLIQIIGLCSFIIFSFFYTDKVMNVIREEDRIMIELKNIQDIVNKDAKDATIKNDTIIPGINGKEINIDKSYKKMKNYGIFQQDKIIYNIVYPNISIINHKDKYLIQGNSNKQMVSIIFILNNNKYIDKIEKIISSKEIIANYFVSYDYLITNSTHIKEMNQREFYSYGENGIYTPDNLLFSNNLISRISNNTANLCICIKKDKKILDLCSKNDLYTIIPNIIGKDKPYDAIKNSLTSGSIILLDMEKDTVESLSIIIDYIKGKGLKIVGLSQLLSEEY